MIRIDIPTSKEQSTGWSILNSPLGCGTRILQGWSEGFGVQVNRDFEKDLAKLIIWSKFYHGHILTTTPPNTGYNAADLWNHTSPYPGANLGVNIGVGFYKHQFLKPKQTYTISSLVPWIERFEAFVKKHDLGDFSKSHVWGNINYRGNMNITALWTWNGNCPTAAALGLGEWKNNPEPLYAQRAS